MRECPSCALDVPKDAEECPYCAYEFPRPKSGSVLITWLMVGLMILFGIPVLAWLLGWLG